MAMEGDLATKFSQVEEIEGGHLGQVRTLRGVFLDTEEIEVSQSEHLI
jgi:hypothetical protein